MKMNLLKTRHASVAQCRVLTASELKVPSIIFQVKLQR
jgi:hypothetical protein